MSRALAADTDDESLSPYCDSCDSRSGCDSLRYGAQFIMSGLASCEPVCQFPRNPHAVLAMIASTVSPLGKGLAMGMKAEEALESGLESGAVYSDGQ